MIRKSISKPQLSVPNYESVPKSKPIRLPTSDAVISLSISGVSSSNLSTAATSNLSTTATTNNLSAPTNPNTTPKLTTQRNPKTKNDLTELEIGNEDASTNNLAFTQKQPLTSNIPPATITEDKSLATIFSFEFEKTTAMPLFSGATLEAKPITAMYTDAKVEGQFIKLIFDSSSAGSIITRQLMDQLGYQVDRTASARIITADRVTKTPIGKINDFFFKVNGIGQHIYVPATCGHFKTPPRKKLLIELEEEKEKPTWKAYQVHWADADHNKLPPILSWNNNPKGKQKEELTWETDDLTWTNNEQEEPSKPIELDWDAKPVINFLEPKEFHEHYQNLAPTREEQEQWLAQLNTRLCHHCLIPSDFEYCDDCDLIYNLPPHMIYMILEEEEPISICVLESESLINHDPDSNDDDENTGSSSVQNGNNNKDDSNSDSNSDLNYEQYIALPDLSKEQKLKWYSDNGEGIMPEHAHDTDTGFDLRYPGKEAIKLEPHSHTCIDLKVALKILATTMVQLASKSSLVKREINIRGEIIDVGYIGNIITMLQNDSEKAYIIEPNKKIAQAIFMPLVRVAQLVLVEKREKLGITARGIQGFGSTDRIDVPVNMAEEKIVGQGEIISTGQAISISPYNQYMLAIERKEKDQAQIFEAKASLCESGEVGLINLHIPAKDYSYIKIPIYNNTENIIEIPAGTIIRYLNTKMEDQLPNPIPDFPQLCGYVDITLQTIYGRNQCYLLQPKQLEQMNMGNLDPLQHMQLKMLLNQFNDIFASKNEFG
ncbi:hypothetical protein G9A89_015810 [Geosiphon pyriformis]|nr:hypothetical protein G9A89_015810 [Geosiphon pyriformis]